MSLNKSIISKIARWKEEGRKVVKDEHGLIFHEGMTPIEKIEWIENEIEDLRGSINFLNRQEKEILNKRDIDFDFDYMEKVNPFIKPDMSIKDFQERRKKYVEDFREAEIKSIENYKKEYDAEIREYQEDIKYYKKINYGM